MNYRDAVAAFYRKHRQEGERALTALIGAHYDARYDPTTKYGRKHDMLPSRYEACDGEEITELPSGWKLKVEFAHNDYSDPPWNNCDGMGVVTDWMRAVDNEKMHGYWILNSDRNFARYYDWKATLPEALRDGWNTKPYRFRSKYEQAMAAMKSTYEYLYDWCNDRWWYVGLIVTLLDEDDEELAQESCWGYESNAMSSITEQVRDWAAHMIQNERRRIRQEAHYEKVAHRFADAMECGL